MVGVTHDELRALCKAAAFLGTGRHSSPALDTYYAAKDFLDYATDSPLMRQIRACGPDVVLGLLDEIARLAPSPSREACCWPCFKDLNQSDGVADLYAEREDEYVAACGICGHDMEG